MLVSAIFTIITLQRRFAMNLALCQEIA